MPGAGAVTALEAKAGEDARPHPPPLAGVESSASNGLRLLVVSKQIPKLKIMLGALQREVRVVLYNRREDNLMDIFRKMCLASKVTRIVCFSPPLRPAAPAARVARSGAGRVFSRCQIFLALRIFLFLIIFFFEFCIAVVHTNLALEVGSLSCFHALGGTLRGFTNVSEAP